HAIGVIPEGAWFTLCPAAACQPARGASPVGAACAPAAPKTKRRAEACDPPAEIRAAVLAIAARTQLDVGGIEYLVDDRDGKPYVYDINALSNFVADGPRVIGFDPFERLVDYLARRAWGEV